LSLAEPAVDASCARMNTAIEQVYRKWHDYARAGDVEGLLSLYAPDATLESPLVPALLGQPSGLLRGHDEIHRFLAEGTRRRPNELVRWYRTGSYFTDGHTLIWEYPRTTPDGDQVDILEVMEITDGKIQRHRIYWGWFGTKLLVRSVVQGVPAGAGEAEQSWF
jgi:hypothetical protein